MILTKTEESRLLDSMAMKEYGIPEMVLMENAGSSVVRLTEKYVDWDSRPGSQGAGAPDGK